MRGGGAFVCGEETALLASLEGLTGEPRQRPPFPAQKGLWGQPTNINNVETWANVPHIILEGPKKFSRFGTESSKGTKVFSLVGKVVNTGLIEVPMGLSLREVIFDIGGGVPGGKRFKAIQTGGPSGGCLPENLIDLPIDYEQLTSAGTIMGSGGMIVMDEGTCMVDVARYFLDFLSEESCGKCTPCREGIGRMLDILNNICEGHGKEEDLELLEELAQAVQDFSLCGLGQTAPNPVLTTLQYFRNEYLSHIRDHRCPAGVCKALCTAGVVAFLGHLWSVLRCICPGLRVVHDRIRLMAIVGAVDDGSVAIGQLLGEVSHFPEPPHNRRRRVGAVVPGIDGPQTGAVPPTCHNVAQAVAVVPPRLRGREDVSRGLARTTMDPIVWIGGPAVVLPVLHRLVVIFGYKHDAEATLLCEDEDTVP